MNPCFCTGPKNGDAYCRCVMIQKGLKLNQSIDPIKDVFDQAAAKTRKENEDLFKSFKKVKS